MGKGETLGADAPPFSHFPLSDQPSPENTTDAVRELKPQQVFTPAPTQNPVLFALRAEGLYIKKLGTGHHLITCPWQKEHAGETKRSAYTEPTDKLPFGSYGCAYKHAKRPGIHHLLDRLNIDPEKARCKPIIRVIAGELNPVVAAAERSLAARGTHFQSDGSIVMPVVDPSTGDVRLSLQTEPALTIALSAAADWERFDGRAKEFRRVDPPVRIVQLLLKAPAYDHLPRLNGLARQPYFRKCDGELVTTPGFDEASGIYAHFDPAAYSFPEPTRESAIIALAELSKPLAEFHFENAHDRAAALCAMLTAAVRSTLPLAPAFNVTAASPGSGKSYLVSTIAPLASPGTPMFMSYPANSDEATKAMLAALIQEPAAIVFDDMQTDWLPHGMMNRLLTSTTVTDRLLGSSRTATARTNALVIGTGNNVYPIRDMARRVVTVRLAPPSDTPATLQYVGRPAELVRTIRETYVAHALTIIRAWLAAGLPKSDVPPIGSFERWSDLCRQPLLWLGEADPATSLLEQLKTDPDQEILGRFLAAWAFEFGTKQVTVREIVNRTQQDITGDLADALSDLPVFVGNGVNNNKLGWYLKRQADRLVDGYKLLRDPTTERTAWRVEMTTERVEEVDNRPRLPRADPEDIF